MNRRSRGGEAAGRWSRPAGVWLLCVAALTRMELLRFMRTNGVHRYLIVPAWLVLPAVLMLYVAGLSLGAFEYRVAIPADSPDALALSEHLAAVDLTAVPVADPSAHFTAGEVDAAVIAVEEGDGLYEATELEGAERYRYRLTALTLNPRVRTALSNAATSAGHFALEELVVAAGGDPRESVWVATVDLLLEQDAAPPNPLGEFQGSYLAAYLLWLLGLVGYLLLVSGPVADRSAGVVESLLVAPVPPTAYLVGRAMAVSLIQLLTGGLVFGSVYLLVAGRVDILPPLSAVLALCLAATVLNSAYLAVGTLSPSMKSASSAAGTLWLLTTLGFVLVAGLQLPTLVPVVGLINADSAVDWWLAASGSLAAEILLVWLVARTLERQPQIKLGGTL